MENNRENKVRFFAQYWGQRTNKNDIVSGFYLSNKMKIENSLGYLMIISLFVALFVTISVVSGITIALAGLGLTFITFAFIVLAVYLMEK